MRDGIRWKLKRAGPEGWLSQTSMTMHYTHVVPELAQDAAVRMEQALWGPAPTRPDEDGTKMAQRPS